MKRIAQISLIAVVGLAACQTTTGTGGTGTTGGTGGTGGTTPAPNFAANGFSATETSATARVSVVEKSGGEVVDHRTGIPSDMVINYNPATDTLRVMTIATDPGGGPDTEDVTFTGGGPNYVATIPDNYANVQAGSWAWAADGVIDNGNVGIHKHNFSAFDGDIYTQPTSGSAQYTSRLLGTIERYDSVGSTSQAFEATGDIGVAFGQSIDNVGGTFFIDSTASGGVTGSVSVVGTLAGDNTFAGSSSGSITVPGGYGTTSPAGTMAGLLAGPNVEETAGLVSAASGSGTSNVTSVTGAWLGTKQ